MLELNRIYCADSLELMKSIPSKSIDLVLTDPPYGITACEWDTVPDLQNLWTEFKRIGKERTAYVFTASQPFTTDLINSNRKWFKYEWIWDKVRPSNPMLAKKQCLKTHENILIFSENTVEYNPQEVYRTNGRPMGGRNPSKTDLGFGKSITKKYTQEFSGYPKSILSIGTDNIKNEHPTQKPVKLMQYLIKTYSNDGDLILDPFLGSGTTALACLMENRNFIGIEKEPKYCAIAEKRIKLYQSQGKLEL